MAALPREEALSAERIANLENIRPRTATTAHGNAPAGLGEGASAADLGGASGPAAEARGSSPDNGAGAHDRTKAKAVPPPTDGDEEQGWPSAEAEAAFLGEAAGNGEVVTPVTEPETEEDDLNGSTPPLASLMEEIPAQVREALEDLFRAKYSRVIRVRKKDLH